ncbi:MAG: S-adenosylmethionine:tRNA ribosyltransferase-isomerase [Paludibacteraceae bacterium]|nr:S-adenosylmethionine:tRNA ribosyltransferase-isomerase [Paludibacteraceae bacterium]
MTPIKIEEYNYPLPENRIAKYPLPQRDHSKLLVYKQSQISENIFYNIGEYIPSQSLLIYNNTRVIHARLVFHKESGARVEIFCLEPLIPHDYESALAANSQCTWKCMIGNLKKWKGGALSLKISINTTIPTPKTIILRAERIATTGNTHEVQFTWDDSSISFAELLELVGELPIPPYLNRPSEEQDKQTYQTVYSHIKGSVAAPTAGLHFTHDVLQNLRTKGVHTDELTLHVGAGTFQPVKTEDANEHTMHAEIIAVSRQTIANLIEHLGQVVAVGTTSMRTLESLYFIGCQLDKLSQEQQQNLQTIQVQQFEPYTSEQTLTTHQSLEKIIDYLNLTKQDVLHAETRIMIKPGYEFHLVDMLITNFHQPKSTLLLLVSAFVGEDWRKIYDYALTHDFRFLSYGDSSILIRNS